MNEWRDIAHHCTPPTATQSNATRRAETTKCLASSHCSASPGGEYPFLPPVLTAKVRRSNKSGGISSTNGAGPLTEIWWYTIPGRRGFQTCKIAVMVIHPGRLIPAMPRLMLSNRAIPITTAGQNQGRLHARKGSGYPVGFTVLLHAKADKSTATGADAPPNPGTAASIKTVR